MVEILLARTSFLAWYVTCLAERLPSRRLFDATLAKGTQEGEAMEVIKVAARSRSTAVAGAIAGVVREKGRAEVQAIGAGAVNQALKAVAIARGYLELDGINVVCIPSFVEVEIDGQERTALKMSVEPR
jgi:stage V sporulation protein S